MEIEPTHNVSINDADRYICKMLTKIVSNSGDNALGRHTLRQGVEALSSATFDVVKSLKRVLPYRKTRSAAAAPNRPQLIDMQACDRITAKVAGNRAHVLIIGATGTVKELFARAIHGNSSCAAGAPVAVDCAALPETLVESLLFGREKGAFTGADRSRPGLITQARKGTLFLDEVGELRLSIQKAFLRVLQERCYRRVGDCCEKTSDFRRNIARWLSPVPKKLTLTPYSLLCRTT